MATPAHANDSAVETPHLVLVAGLNNTPAIWDDVVAALDAMLPVAPIVLRPHLPALDSAEVLARLMLDQLPERFAFAGFSFGGYVGMAMLEAAPERFSRFALVCSSTRAESPAGAPLRRRAMEIAASGGYESMIARAFPNTVHPSRLQDPVLLKRRAEMIEGYGVERFIAHSQACLDRPDLTDTLRRYPGPRLLVGTTEDKVVPLEIVAGIAQDIPAARFAAVAECGHLLPLERPQALAAELAAWLAVPSGR